MPWTPDLAEILIGQRTYRVKFELSASNTRPSVIFAAPDARISICLRICLSDALRV